MTHALIANLINAADESERAGDAVAARQYRREYHRLLKPHIIAEPETPKLPADPIIDPGTGTIRVDAFTSQEGRMVFAALAALVGRFGVSGHDAAFVNREELEHVRKVGLRFLFRPDIERYYVEPVEL